MKFIMYLNAIHISEQDIQKEKGALTKELKKFLGADVLVIPVYNQETRLELVSGTENL